MRALVGAALERSEVGTVKLSDNGFAFAAGGGVDLRLKCNILLRAVQLDYLRTYTFDTAENNLRFSVGIVVGLL